MLPNPSTLYWPDPTWPNSNWPDILWIGVIFIVFVIISLIGMYARFRKYSLTIIECAQNMNTVEFIFIWFIFGPYLQQCVSLCAVRILHLVILIKRYILTKLYINYNLANLQNCISKLPFCPLLVPIRFIICPVVIHEEKMQDKVKHTELFYKMAAVTVRLE